MFEGFEEARIDTGEAEIFARSGGSGPPLLLLHGHPQTSAMWHLVAPELAKTHFVVCADLRGYGASSKPETDDRHAPYSKRSMARDMLAVMGHFGHQRFAVIGHDRGGRVGYRLALDHPDRVTQLAVLDIIPTLEAYERADRAFGMGYWHWFFLAQPSPIPENLIAGDPDAIYLRRGGGSVWTPAALAEYRDAYMKPETVRAMCEDYRAGATIDCDLDAADRDAGRRIACPLLVLWGANGYLDQWYDVPGVWRGWADDVEGQSVPCGHYLPEEAPDETQAHLKAFLEGG